MTQMARSAFNVVPSDTANLPGATTSGLYIGGAGSGNLTITVSSGKTLTLTGLAAGTLLPIIVTRVWSTGTDTTNMVGLI